MLGASHPIFFGAENTDRNEGTDQSQGRGQIISNINACLAVQSTIKGTLGPYGGDLLLVDENGRQTITNDGATVMKVGEPKDTTRNWILKSPSSSTSYTPQPASSQTSPARKTLKLVMEQHPWWYWQEKSLTR